MPLEMPRLAIMRFPFLRFERRAKRGFVQLARATTDDLRVGLSAAPRLYPRTRLAFYARTYSSIGVK